MALEVREAHLDLFALITRLKKRLRFHVAACQLASVFVQITRDPARGDIRTALRFECADTASGHRCFVTDAIVGADMPGGGQRSARRQM